MGPYGPIRALWAHMGPNRNKFLLNSDRACSYLDFRISIVSEMIYDACAIGMFRSFGTSQFFSVFQFSCLYLICCSFVLCNRTNAVLYGAGIG